MESGHQVDTGIVLAYPESIKHCLQVKFCVGVGYLVSSQEESQPQPISQSLGSLHAKHASIAGSYFPLKRPPPNSKCDRGKPFLGVSTVSAQRQTFTLSRLISFSAVGILSSVQPSPLPLHFLTFWSMCQGCQFHRFYDGPVVSITIYFTGFYIKCIHSTITLINIYFYLHLSRSIYSYTNDFFSSLTGIYYNFYCRIFSRCRCSIHQTCPKARLRWSVKSVILLSHPFLCASHQL